jgi:hypothetical protein
MKAHILRGSKQEIAYRLVQLRSEVREAIVFEDEPAPVGPEAPCPTEDVFAEMAPFIGDAPDVDDAREAANSPMDGE